MKYRKLWEKINGPIPKDEQGRSYEIHHIDGNRKNNNIDNLICISIEDHYKIHLLQGDYLAAALIAERIELPKEKIKELYTKSNTLYKRGHTPWNKGKTGVYTEDQLNNIREGTKKATTGVKKSKEHVEKVAIANRGKKRSEETRKKLSDAHRGKKRNSPSEETKTKIANNQPKSKKIMHIKNEIFFNSMNEARKYYNISRKALIKLIKEGVFIVL